MPTTMNRNRLVYFRVSEDEFVELTCLRERAGARSLSEMARMAVLQLSEKNRTANGETLAKTVRDLSREIERLKIIVGELAGTSRTPEQPVKSSRAESGIV